ncbi:MAG: hypothetical protein ABIU05_14415 [Nitrospirales bacterium]
MKQNEKVWYLRISYRVNFQLSTYELVRIEPTTRAIRRPTINAWHSICLSVQGVILGSMQFLACQSQSAKVAMPTLWVDLDILVIIVTCLILIGLFVWIVLKMGE